MAQLTQTDKRSFGFTIVELLIVIVVIGILAAIVIVAYNGIQARANATRAIADLTTVNKYIQNYYALNSSYPVSTGPSCWMGSDAHPNAYVPGILPSIASNLPTPAYTGSGGDSSLYQQYIYCSNGTDYKLLAHDGQYRTLCPTVKAQNAKIADSQVRDCWAFGYWSPGAALW